MEHFSSVPNNELPGLDFTPFTHENAFQPNFHEKVFFVKPEVAKPCDGDMDITFTWCVPSELVSGFDCSLLTIRFLEFMKTFPI